MPRKQTGSRPKANAACPCGQIPTELIVRAAKGSKHGEVSGNCCGYWSLEFRAGYPKDEAELVKRAGDAWNNGPRGKTK